MTTRLPLSNQPAPRALHGPGRGAQARWRPMLKGLACLGAGLLAAGLSFDFGLRAGGTLVAVIAALNGAVFATLLVDAALDAAPRRGP